jgi:hypothetical protein
MAQARILKAEQLIRQRDEALLVRDGNNYVRGKILRLQDGTLAVDLLDAMYLLRVETLEQWVKQVHSVGKKGFV